MSRGRRPGHRRGGTGGKFARVSPGAREVMCRLGVVQDFAGAARDAGRIGNVPVGREKLRQVVEAEAAAVAAARDTGRLPASWSAADARVDEAGEGSRTTRVYEGTDGVMVPTVTQAEKDKRRKAHAVRRQRRSAAGVGNAKPLPPARAGTDERFKEVKVGAFYAQRKLLRHPKSLSSRQLSGRDILGLPDKAAIVDALVDKELKDVFYDRPANWFKYLKAKVDAGAPLAAEAEQFAEIKATRDVLVQGQGVANAYYADKAGKPARAQAGQPLEVPEPYHQASWELIRKLVSDIGTGMAAKASATRPDFMAPSAGFARPPHRFQVPRPPPHPANHSATPHGPRGPYWF